MVTFLELFSRSDRIQATALARALPVLSVFD